MQAFDVEWKVKRAQGILPTVNDFWNLRGIRTSQGALRSHALMLLAIPATSASGERVFSSAGHIETRGKYAFSDETLAIMTRLRTNIRALELSPVTCIKELLIILNEINE